MTNPQGPPSGPPEEPKRHQPRKVLLLTLLLAAVGALYLHIYFRYWPALLQDFGFDAPDSTFTFAAHASSFDISECTVPTDTLQSGGPPVDGIPALTRPRRVAAENAEFMRPEDRIIGVRFDGQSAAYPIRILNWHECVNDTIDGKPVAVTYCPLCDSAFVFDRQIGGEVREFGISGLLLNSNVLLFDRQEDLGDSSLWSQVAMRAVCGPAAEAGHRMKLIPSETTTWSDWLRRNPETEVLSLETGHHRDYSRSPYVTYFQSDELMFPVRRIAPPPSERVPSYPPKEKVLVVEAGKETRVYPYSELRRISKREGDSIKDRIAGREITIVYDNASDTARAILPEDSPLSAAHTFWFAWESLQNDYDVFQAKASP